MTGTIRVMDVETRGNLEMIQSATWQEQVHQEARQAVPSNYRDATKIEGWISNYVLAAARKAALSARTGMVAMIGFRDVDSKEGPVVLENAELTFAGERELLKAANAMLRDTASVVGWNIGRFDVPFLLGRSLVHGIQLNLGAPRNYRRVIDLMDMLGGGSLAEWMVAMGLPPKKIQGEALLECTMDELREHLVDDLVATGMIAEHLLPQIGGVK